MPDCFNCRSAVHEGFDGEYDVADKRVECQDLDAVVQRNSEGVDKGECFWPHRFDPIWIRTCDSYDPIKVNEEIR
jgi:hypothetical protein